MADSPYSAAPGEKLDEIIRLAELRLAAQLTLGIAADQRAMTMASILAAITAALLGAWVAITQGGAEIGWPLPLLVVGFSIAVGCVAWSALPRAWEIAGNEPSQWLNDIPTGDSLHNGRAAMAGYYDDMLAANDRQLICNANWMRAAFVAVIMTLVVAACSAVFGG